jgi:hypothetical protein
MLCTFYKWKISRAFDSGKPLSAAVKSHAGRCGSCHEFLRLSEKLQQRLTEDAASLFASGVPEDIGKRVLSSLPPEAPGRSPDLQKLRRLRLRPVLVAAGALLIISIGTFWIVTSRSNKMPSLDSLFAFDSPRAELQKALLKAESPYEKEIQELRRALSSAAAYLQARFDIGLAD